VIPGYATAANILWVGGYVNDELKILNYYKWII